MVVVASAMYCSNWAESIRTSDWVVVSVSSYCNDDGGGREAAMGCWLIAMRSCLALPSARLQSDAVGCSFESATSSKVT